MLVDNVQLPHVIVIPTTESLAPPAQNARDVAGDAAQTVDLICRAETYQNARLLALHAWQAPGLGISRTAQIRYGSETWGNRTVRSATLTVTVPARLLKTDLTLARIAEVGVHVRQQPPTLPPEVNDDQAEGTVQLDFHEHGDPPHRFG